MRAKKLAALIVVCTAMQVLAGSSTQLVQLSPAELTQAIQRCPVAFVPAGINEWHGEQSACGLDALKAETLCRMAADSLGGVCFPTVWLGPDASTPFDPAKYPRGTITIDKARYDTAAEQILTGIEAMGFKVVVYLSGHYPGVIPEVAAKFNQAGRMKVISVSENQVVADMPAGDHAGAWETSMLMVLRPGLVDLSRLPPLPSTTQPAGDVIPPAYDFRQRAELYGIYRLDPRIWANPHYGRRGTQAVFDGLAREIGKTLNDANYAKNRKPIDLPKDDRDHPEVRYDHLLPCQWMQRFERAPIVYVPLAPADDSIDATTARAVQWACDTGGMVLPAIAYGPAADRNQDADGGCTNIAPETYAAIVSEIVADLADMDFRIIALVAAPSLSTETQDRLARIASPDGQCAIVLEDPRSEQPAAVRAAAARLVPRDARSIELSDAWTLNGRDRLYSLSEDVYGPGETRVYEYELTCGAEDAPKAALLDLGSVRNHAQVSINDSPPMIDHWPPYRFIITGMLHTGVNHIRVTVKNLPQPTLDPWFFGPRLPRLIGPVTLTEWTAAD